MRNITYAAAEKQEEETVSVLLMAVLEYAHDTILYRGLDEVKVAMKTVRYSPLNKAQTIIASLVMGCKHTKDINEVLPREVAAANYLGMNQFPEQSQINRYLTRFSEENVSQLRQAHNQVFMEQSQARRVVGRVVVDIDQCGLVANGQTYEFARKGYFPRKRGEQGYQLSAAYVGAYAEAVQVYLDPGNVVSKVRLPDLLRDVDQLLATDNPGIVLVRRLDAGFDSGDNRRLLAGLPGYFLLKSAESDSAAPLVKHVPNQAWLPVTEDVYGVEVDAYNGVRQILYELYRPDGRRIYSLLLTNLPRDEFGVARLFAFYNERQTIEAFFCQSREVFHIQTLRSRRFNAIAAFLYFVIITHNLLVWLRRDRLAYSDLASVSLRQLVQKLTSVRAHITWDGYWHLFILDSSHWARRLLDAFQPQLVQLTLPFARLHKI